MTLASPPVTPEDRARTALAALSPEERRGLSRAITDVTIEALQALAAEAAARDGRESGEEERSAGVCWTAGA